MGRKTMTEHAGGKNGAGFWGRRAEAKAVSRKLRRRRGAAQVCNAVGHAEGSLAPSADDIREALAVEGELKPSGLRARVQAARKTPWTAPPRPRGGHPNK